MVPMPVTLMRFLRLQGIMIQAKNHKGKGRGRVMGKTLKKMIIVKTVTTVKKTMVCNAELYFISQNHSSLKSFDCK